MMVRRERVLIGVIAAGLIGAVLLFLLGRYLWQESVEAEELRLESFSQQLGQQAEGTIIDARDLLTLLNNSPLVPCSPGHLQIMQEIAVARPHIRAIGYWQAADRQCGAGFIQGLEFTPPRASRIYNTGMIAWWPSQETEVGGVQLFLMRLGDHDVVIDPRLMMDTGPGDGQIAGLWVEGLPMFTNQSEANLPHPDTLKPGLTVDSPNQRIISRFSLGTIFPIDVVAQQPISNFWKRYLPTLLTAGIIGLLPILLWGLIVLRYSRHQLSLAAELRDAITKRLLTVNYQPIVNMTTNTCTGAESLARWTRESGEIISPDVFIPIVEEAGLSSELAIMMFDSILRDMGEHLRKTPGFTINLNLAAQDLATDRLMNHLEKELKACNVPASAINLEITERALVDSDDARQRIRTLRHRGHKIAIDDFGTGYSSLAYLESFELDVLKIDKSFIDAIETHGAISNVIPHVISMSKSLQLAIVAEGVEYDHQIKWLISQDVLLGQGYAFSKPLTVKKFIDFVSVRQPKKDSNTVINLHKALLDSGRMA